MNGNLGKTRLRRRRGRDDPMRTFDALPAPLRKWLSEAALPWSPVSARRLWNRARSKGLTIEETLFSLSQAETRTLARAQQVVTQQHDTQP
ncbi:MAG: DUF6525 family protein [Pseudomonadota bacterium]